MSEKSNTLYLKYRPQTFEDVLGQEEVVSVLKHSIENKNIAHAYLFFGDRGTGKTSVARIFAKELGVSNEDIYEIDAASNRGINDIREIRNAVDILPFSSEYKIYIIDEVHMLTKEAFNALLKTLEEPPKHIIFILATTEKDKVLPTILSRCQVYNFKNPDLNILSTLIKTVVEKEGGEIDDLSVLEIAKKGNASYRDTLSILQKALTIFDKKITYERLEEIFGKDNDEIENQFLLALSNKNKEDVFKIYLENQNNIKIDVFLENITNKIRESLLIKNSSFYSEKIKSENMEKFEFLSTLNINSLILKKLLEVQKYMKNNINISKTFELFLFDLFV